MSTWMTAPSATEMEWESVSRAMRLRVVVDTRCRCRTCKSDTNAFQVRVARHCGSTCTCGQARGTRQLPCPAAATIVWMQTATARVTPVRGRLHRRCQKISLTSRASHLLVLLTATVSLVTRAAHCCAPLA